MLNIDPFSREDLKKPVNKHQVHLTLHPLSTQSNQLRINKCLHYYLYFLRINIYYLRVLPHNFNSSCQLHYENILVLLFASTQFTACLAN